MILLVLCLVSGSVSKCPSKNGVLNVHLIAHSHLDAGWLKTVDQYFYGLNDSVQQAGVQFIFDSVVRELSLDGSKKFVLCEMGYFWRWWRTQPESLRVKIRSMLESGQLTIAGGGWVSNDEACTHYGSVIEQMSLGFRFINANFNNLQPRVTWQIDPFGHSIEHVRLFKEMGYKTMFINRIDHYASTDMRNRKSHVFEWESMDTIHLQRHYDPPNGLCFDELCCDDEPVIDDNSSERNIDRKMDLLVHEALFLASESKVNHVLIPMGSDFHYQNAWRSYKSIDKLIERSLIALSDLNVFYSSPECYSKSVFAALNKTNEQEKRSNDFLPHSHSEGLFWTGYYTSRPGLKKLIRSCYHWLRALKMIKARSVLKDNPNWDYFDLEDNHAIAQHHDAVTGTSKQHVVNDYLKRLCSSFQQTIKSFSSIVENHSERGCLETCAFSLNMSQCEFSENKRKFTLSIFNPFGWTVEKYIRIPVRGRQYDIIDLSNGHRVKSEVRRLSDGIKWIHERQTDSVWELVFRSRQSPLSFVQYEILMVKNEDLTQDDLMSVYECEIENDAISLRMDLFEFVILNKRTGVSIVAAIELGVYEGDDDTSCDGMYLMCDGNERVLGRPRRMTCEKNQYSQIVQMHFSRWIDANLTFRLDADSEFVELEGVFGDLGLRGNYSRNAFIRYSTNVTDSAFYTDSNCRYMQKRTLDQRSYPFNQTSRISGNMYPVCNRISINDSRILFGIVTDRTQAGYSFKKSAEPGNTIEFIVNRKTIRDDGLGVGEILNESVRSLKNGEIAGAGVLFRHLLSLAPNNDHAQTDFRKLAITQSADSIMFILDGNSRIANVAKIPEMPTNLHLLSFEVISRSRKRSKYLVRLEHLSDSEIGNIKFDIETLFNDKIEKITKIDEMFLGGNAVRDSNLSDYTISVPPTSIKTFSVETESVMNDSRRNGVR